jgi:hypothetical protein
MDTFEHSDLGEVLTAAVTDAAALENEILFTVHNSIHIRILHGMTPAAAREFAAWLLEAADEADTRNLTSEISRVADDDPDPDQDAADAAAQQAAESSACNR